MTLFKGVGCPSSNFLLGFFSRRNFCLFCQVSPSSRFFLFDFLEAATSDSLYGRGETKRAVADGAISSHSS